VKFTTESISLNSLHLGTVTC